MATFNQWIKIEENGEMPNEFEAVLIPAPLFRTKLTLAIYIGGEFLINYSEKVVPTHYMRIDTSNISLENNFKYKKAC